MTRPDPLALGASAGPCGLRSPDCPRPDYCNDCLPRDRKHIHERVLARCDPAWYGLADNPPKVFAALKAVVDVCVDAQADSVDGRLTDIEGVWPSQVIAAIAAALGITEGNPDVPAR